MRYCFKALFEKEDDGGYTVTFPNIEEAVTFGNTLDEAFEMAKQCLSLCLETRIAEGETIPDTNNQDEKGDCHLICVDI